MVGIDLVLVVVGFFIFNHKITPSLAQKTTGLKIRKQQQNDIAFVEHAQDETREQKHFKKISTVTASKSQAVKHLVKHFVKI